MLSPTVDWFYGVYVRVEQNRWFLHVEHRADTPYIVARTTGHDADTFNVSLKV